MNRISTIIASIILIFLNSCQQSKERNAPEGFVLHPDFKLELVASEPLISDPVDMEFDEQGRAFVLEMPGYPLRDEQSRLVILEDENEDGIFDSRKVVAENLGLASSIVPYQNGFLVASPPDLLYLQDTTGDDIMDKRQAILTGFSTGNLQHNFNGLTYGIDNWYYGGNGGNNGEPHFIHLPNQKVPLRDGDFKFQIEQQHLERIGQSMGGFELAFDNYGRMFETHNLVHTSHLVFEERYIENMPTEPAYPLTSISDHDENGLSRIYPIGEQETRVNHPEQSGYFSGACGITFYGGGAFPQGLNNTLFVADVVLNLIHLDVLEADSAIFKAARHRDKVEFLASNDRSFRPVNMTSGPSGALYVLDMHREVIEHPQWIPDELEKDLDLKAGRNQGRIYRIVPKKDWTYKKTALDKNDTKALITALEDKNQWTRLTAQRLLIENQNTDAIPFLEKKYKESKNPLARLHALRTLEGLNALTVEMIQVATTDKSSEVREHILKMIEPFITENPTIIQSVLELTKDENARVRMQAALTLSVLDDATFDNQAKNIIPALQTLLAHPETDKWTVMAIASAARRNIPEFWQVISKKEQPSWQELLAIKTLGKYIGQQRDFKTTAILLRADNQQLLATMLNALAQGWQGYTPSPKDRAGRDGVSKTLGLVEDETNIALLLAHGRLREAVKINSTSQFTELVENSQAKVLDTKLSLSERLKYLEIVAFAPFDKRSGLLYQLLDNRQPIELQKGALSQLWQSNDPNIGQQLLQHWDDLAPQTRQQAGNILLYKSQNHDLLLTALENNTINIGELNLDLERRRELLWSTDKTIQKRAEALFSDAGVVTRKEAMDKMKPALAISGSANKGKKIFEAQCSQCHRYGEIGKEVGPVLTEINRKSKESLLHDIIDPNAAVDTRYVNHRVEMADGNIYLGIIERETDNQITLRMMGGTETTISKNNISKLTSQGLSMMPEGQEENMSVEEMADLLAFLQEGK